jgi:hypothetical protein
LGLVVVALLIFVAYVFLINPALNGLVVKGYDIGKGEVISSIVEYTKTCQSPLPLTSYNNETVNLVAVECYQ